MQAIILAAGYGGRMWPLTNDTNKTLLRVGDKLIIERIVDSLVEHQITRIAVVLGHHGQELQSFLTSTYETITFSFVWNPRYRELNNVVSLALAMESIDLDEDILLLEADLVFDPGILARLIHSHHDNVALVSHYQPGMNGTVVRLVDGIVKEMITPERQDGDFDFLDTYKTINIYRLSKVFCRDTLKGLLSYYADTIDSQCFYELVIGILIYLGKVTIHADIIENEPWHEIDDPNDLHNADYVFNPETRRQALEASQGGYWPRDIVDFSYIRNMYFPTKRIYEDLKSHLPSLLQNYGSNQKTLDQKLSYLLHCSPGRLHLLNGASQAFPLLADYLGDTTILIPEPTFGEYLTLSKSRISYRDSGSVSIDELEELSQPTQAVVIVNPNNPTGTTIATSEIYALVRGHPEKLFIIDESFIEFSDQPSIMSFVEQTSNTNVLILKSLSKSLGVPGLRMGYVYTCDKLLHDYIGHKLPIWNVNSVAEYLLEALLQQKPLLDSSYTRTVIDREAFASRLAGLSSVSKVFPSGGNFLLIKLVEALDPSIDLTSRLLREFKIFVKDCSAKFHDGKMYLRIAVRLPAENEYLADCLEAICG